MNYDERTKVVVYLSPYQVEELKKMLTTSGFEYPDSAINYAVRTLVSDGIKKHCWIGCRRNRKVGEVEMTDCNKVIKDIEYAKDLLQNRPEQDTVDYKVWEVLDDALDLINDLRSQIAMLVGAQHELCELLKEQEDEKKRIMKVIWDTLHEGLSIDTVADQDWVYEQIRHRIEDTNNKEGGEVNVR